MKITPAVFDAYLKCSTKCWLRAIGESADENPYAVWVREQNLAYREIEAARLIAAMPPDEVSLIPHLENAKAATWRLACSLAVQTKMESDTIESEIHMVERLPATGRGKAAQFVPIRFVFTNKLGKDDKLLLAYDAAVLSKELKRELPLGKIIHGDNHVTLKVKTSALAGEVRKRLDKIATLISNPAPPDLVLNRHCAACEFQARCRKIAVEKDDLSLLAGMSEKERQKLRSKGIFTVTQLSYTFRPRRRSKRLRDKREKYHHSLKALAIREKKIHIVGSPELKIEGTPVYLDVEGLPDRDFYYLIGVRIGNGESAVQHSLWADSLKDEGNIWREFLTILETVEKPVLIHYGRYETIFLKRMCELYVKPLENSIAAKAIQSAMNLVSFVYAQLYFPVLSNRLKDINRWAGGTSSEGICSGLDSIVARSRWEEMRDSATHRDLILYNAEDCLALQRVFTDISRICLMRDDSPHCDNEVVNADLLKRDLPHRLGTIVFALPEFDHINKAAYWDYQREKVQVRHPQKKTAKTRRKKPSGGNVFNKTIKLAALDLCPECGHSNISKTGINNQRVNDLKFGRSGVKRWVVMHVRRRYRCNVCGAKFIDHLQEWPDTHEGPGLLAYVIYQLVELRISHRAIGRSLNDLFGMNLPRTTVSRLKTRAAKFYSQTCVSMLDSLVAGRVLHIDETSLSIEGGLEFAWVFCSQDRVVFQHTQTREGTFLKDLLQGFKGVLITDFYAAYESIPCPQQKCLIHLIRDLNNDLLKEPFNYEMKALARDFCGVLRPMVDTIDKFGLKARYLRKHIPVVRRFFRCLSTQDYTSVTAVKYRQRFEKNRNTLFTFLDHDGVPWNNNAAEHAVKALAILRQAIGGSSTQAGMDDYLVLLSISETCNYMGVSFLDFLRSGEKDIHTFAERRPPARHA